MDFRYHGREVTLRTSNAYNANAGAGFLFTASLAYYVKNVFLANRSLPKLLLLTGASYLVAQEWSKFFLLPTLQEAAMINNHYEIEHRQTLKGGSAA